MSYVITIRRPDGRPALSAQDFECLLAADHSLARKDSGIIWTQGSKEFWLNIEADHLWTDALSKRTKEAEGELEKLRSIATYLNASVFGEEGEDLSTEGEITDPSSTLSAVGRMIFLVLTLPFVILLFVVRIPQIIQKLKKKLK